VYTYGQLAPFDRFPHVAIDLRTEKIFSFRAARSHLPRSVSYQTLKRWSMVGRMNRKGVLVKLEMVRHGRELCTSFEAYERFVKKLGG
jgi:hypothetical protein